MTQTKTTYRRADGKPFSNRGGASVDQITHIDWGSGDIIEEQWNGDTLLRHRIVERCVRCGGYKQLITSGYEFDSSAKYKDCPDCKGSGLCKGSGAKPDTPPHDPNIPWVEAVEPVAEPSVIGILTEQMIWRQEQENTIRAKARLFLNGPHVTSTWFPLDVKPEPDWYAIANGLFRYTRHIKPCKIKNGKANPVRRKCTCGVWDARNLFTDATGVDDLLQWT